MIPSIFAHGLAGDNTPADWPPLTAAEVDTLLRGYPALGTSTRIEWHSPLPRCPGRLPG